MSPRIRRLATAGLCLAAGLAGTVLLSPGTAQAAPGLTGKQFVSSSSPATTLAKTWDAKCPTGKVIISGGAFIEGAATIKLTEMRPVVTGNLFRAAARNTYGRVTAWKLHVYAICANEPPGYTYVSEDSTPNASPQRSVSIPCPGGKQALGVGGRAAVEANRNVTLAWVTPVSNVGSSSGSVAAQGGEPQNWTSTTYLICASPLGATVSGCNGSPNSVGTKIRSASCANGKLAAFGGAITTSVSYQQGQVLLTAVYPDATMTGGTIIATEDHDGYAGNWSLTSWAICA